MNKLLLVFALSMPTLAHAQAATDCLHSRYSYVLHALKDRLQIAAQSTGALAATDAIAEQITKPTTRDSILQTDPLTVAMASAYIEARDLYIENCGNPAHMEYR